jgi:hypothetical protein
VVKQLLDREDVNPDKPFPLYDRWNQQVGRYFLLHLQPFISFHWPLSLLTTKFRHNRFGVPMRRDSNRLSIAGTKESDKEPIKERKERKSD